MNETAMTVGNIKTTVRDITSKNVRINFYYKSYYTLTSSVTYSHK